MEGHGEIKADAFCIGDFTIKPSRNLVVKGTRSFSLEPRIMDVLCELAARSRDVISREVLVENVWNIEYGADESLTRAISILRKTFKSAGENQEIIQTIPKRGYRLTMDAIELPQTARETQSTQNWQSQKSTEPPPQQNLPVKMTAADISGSVGEVTTGKPAKVRKSMILLISVISLLLFTTSIAFWKRGDAIIGDSLSIEQYGRSVAVLSLVDMSSKSDMEYFADGMSEEILSALTQISDLRVASRTSSFAYKNKDMSLHQIGTALEVSHIIDGSIRKQGDHIKITVRLNNTSNGSQIWSKAYNGKLGNALALQEEISQDIILNLELLLGINVEPFIEIKP